MNNYKMHPRQREFFDRPLSEHVVLYGGRRYPIWPSVWHMANGSTLTFGRTHQDEPLRGQSFDRIVLDQGDV